MSSRLSAAITPWLHLIGTKVRGDTIPRAIAVDAPTGSVAATNPGPSYFTEVANSWQNGIGNIFILQQ